MQFNKKVQMLDAGMTLFKSGENFGNTLGQVKAEMEVYGKVMPPRSRKATGAPHSVELSWPYCWFSSLQ